MPIETQCTGCQRTLRVADEYAGMQARCPICGTTYTVPFLQANAAQPAETTGSQWELQRESQVFGPVSRAELDRWVADGRVDANSLVRELPYGDWLPAGKVYPALLGASPRVAPPQNPFADVDVEMAAVPTVHTPSVAMHRGGLVLALGVISWVMICTSFFGCPIVGPVIGGIAWAMAVYDLREMRAGRMDPSGRSMTYAGMVLGIMQIGFVVCILIPILVFMFLSLLRVGR